MSINKDSSHNNTGPEATIQSPMNALKLAAIAAASLALIACGLIASQIGKPATSQPGMDGPLLTSTITGIPTSTFTTFPTITSPTLTPEPVVPTEVTAICGSAKPLSPDHTLKPDIYHIYINAIDPLPDKPMFEDGSIYHEIALELVDGEDSMEPIIGITTGGIGTKCILPPSKDAVKAVDGLIPDKDFREKTANVLEAFSQNKLSTPTLGCVGYIGGPRSGGGQILWYDGKIVPLPQLAYMATHVNTDQEGITLATTILKNGDILGKQLIDYSIVPEKDMGGKALDTGRREIANTVPVMTVMCQGEKASFTMAGAFLTVANYDSP